MRKINVLVTSMTLTVGTLGVSVYGQAQDGMKPTRESHPVKATPMTVAGKAAERAAYAESGRFYLEARTLLKEGNLAGAEQAAHRALDATPVWHGQKQPMFTLPLLLGDINLRQGKYQEALRYYLPTGQNTWRSGLNLDVALCYVRLGNYQKARQFYSDQATLQYSSITAQDLPGTTTSQSLEASILLARGLDKFFSASEQEAAENLEAAARLAPRNGLIAYYAGKSLLNTKRWAEARPYFERAARYGHGKVAQDAQRRAAFQPPAIRASTGISAGKPILGLPK